MQVKSFNLVKAIIHCIYAIIPISIGISTALSLRDVTHANSDISDVWLGTLLPSTVILFQILSFSIVVACSLRICNIVIKPTLGSFRHPLLLKAFLGFLFTTVILNGLLGTRPFFAHRSLYAGIVFTAIFFEPWLEAQRSIRAAQYGLVSLLLGSGLAAFLAPSLAVQRGYKGLLPIADIRLWGLTPHPNTLGSLCVLLLLLLLYQPFHSKWKQYTAITLGASQLLLAQSKTALLAAVIAFGICVYYRWRGRVGSRGPFLTICIIMFVLSGIVLCEVAYDIPDLLARWSVTEQGSEAMTLTGRDQIWEVAIGEWQKNPLFGHGPSLWDDEFRKSIGMDFAFSAHNQFLQTLSGAGVIGLIGLIFYLRVLLKISLRTAAATKGFTLAMFAVILLRCITETPLELGTIMNADFLAHLVLFQVLSSLLTSPETTESRAVLVH